MFCLSPRLGAKCAVDVDVDVDTSQCRTSNAYEVKRYAGHARSHAYEVRDTQAMPAACQQADSMSASQR
eukprot:1851255-Rhodomonas_salina.1